jgi:hypothetical protein
MRPKSALPLFLGVVIGCSVPHLALSGTINDPAPNLLYKTIGYTEFLPLDSNTGYARSSEPNDGRYATSGGNDGNGTMSTTIYLPSGASLQTIEFAFCNSSTGTIGLEMQVETKAGFGVNVPLLGVVGPVACEDIVVDVSGYNWVVDNNANRFMPRVTFSAFDGSISFAGVVVGYKLQVSPAPATPTFNDVPATDSGYQYIEALAASGITGGCGGGNYCPDNPVTRRQMAIFLAKALGLYFH